MKTYLVILFLNPLGDWGVAEGFDPMFVPNGMPRCEVLAEKAYNYLRAAQDSPVMVSCVETKDINKVLADFGLAA